MNDNTQKVRVIICGWGAGSVDIEGLAVEIPTDKVLARSSIVPEFFAGTRFSRISIQAENIPHAAADIKKFAM